MASQHSRKVEVLRIVFLFTAILAVIGLVAHASLAQHPPTGRRFATSVKPGWQQTLLNSSTPSSLFLPVAIYDSGGIGPVALAVGDLNGDGHPDVVVANYCARTFCNGGIVSVLLGNGDGTFQTAVSYNTGGINPWSVAIGDLNFDGYPDLVVANVCQSSTNCNNGTIAVLFGNGDGTFRAPTIYNAGGYWNFSVVIGDVNGDGIPDLVVGNYLQCITCTEGAVSVFLGDGDGTFQAPVSYSSAGYEVYSVAMGDVNRDGRTDLVVTNNCQSSTACPGPGGLSVLLGNGDGTFQPAVPYSSGGYWGPDAVVIVDVNGDGTPDLVAPNYCLSGSTCPGPGDVAVLIGLGDGTFQQPVSYNSGGYHAFLVAVGDVNGDGHPDLVVANECDSASCNHGVAGVLLGNGDGTFQAAQTYSSGGSTPYAVVVADVNGDGKPDVLMANAFSNTVGVLLNNAPFCTTAPVITVSITPTVLWPPNGKMVPVTLSGTITDTGCNVTSAAYAVTDEYGHVQPSGAVTLGAGGAYSFTVLLQASRLGTDLAGRLYTVSVRASNNASKTGSQVATITVPHDEGR
jgi:hypothetical protein